MSEVFVFPVTFSPFLPSPVPPLVFYSRAFPLLYPSHHIRTNGPTATITSSRATGAGCTRSGCADTTCSCSTSVGNTGEIQRRSPRLMESWWLQFEQVALVNAWTPQEAVQFLPLALKGEGLLYYHSLPQATRQGQLAPLTQALQAHFAPPPRGDLHRAEFQARRQRQQESLGEYCEAVKEAAWLAYPNMQAVDRDMLAKDQFLAGLDSRTMRVRIKELNAATLDDALQAALHHEAI